MEKIRSCVRPIVTIMLVSVLSVMVFQGRAVPIEFFGMVGGTVGWYFYSRSKTPKV